MSFANVVAAAVKYTQKAARSVKGVVDDTARAIDSGSSIPPGRTIGSIDDVGSASTDLVKAGRSVPASSVRQSARAASDIIDAEFVEVVKKGGLKALYKNSKFAKLSATKKSMVIGGLITAGVLTTEQVLEFASTPEGREMSTILTAAFGNAEADVDDYDALEQEETHDFEYDGKIANDTSVRVATHYAIVDETARQIDQVSTVIGLETLLLIRSLVETDDDLFQVALSAREDRRSGNRGF